MYTEESIRNYWMNYFPESDMDEFKAIIEKMNDKEFKMLQSEYERYDEFENNDISEYIDFDYCETVNDNLEWFGVQQMFTSVLLPITNKQFKHIYHFLRQQTILYDIQEFGKSIISHVNFKVYQVLYKSIIFEVNFLSKNGQLSGNTPEKRMDFYCNEYIVEEENRVRFYKEYFAVTQLASIVAKNTFFYITEILKHIKKHKNDINRVFQLSVGKGTVREIKLGNGDTHQDGKSVALVELTKHQKFLYKPHQLRLDQGFDKILKWMNEENKAIHDFKLPKIVSGEKDGFAEFISYEECKNENEIERFYERMGELLAVLYSLNSSDFHYENIIASGEYPVLIDLETIIHPTIANPETQELGSGFAKAEKKYNNSVATIGMLPTFMKGNMDVGGLGVAKEQTSTFKTEFVVDSTSDTIHIERKYFVIQPEQNNPVFQGKYVDSSKYIYQIEQGFKIVYEWIQLHRESYFKFITDTFTGCMGRLIIRPTLYYSQLLNIALHQEFARKIVERKLILCRVAQEKHKNFIDIVLAEHADLMKGSIPYFTYRIGENSIYDSTGKKLLESHLISVYDEIKDKLNEFSESDLADQISYIRDSYITRNNKADRTFIKYQTYENKLQIEKWLRTATDIGDYIAENAIEGINGRGKKDSAWICVTLQGFEEDVWIPSVLGHEFYSGNAGIAFFFTYLWKITGKFCYLESARKAAEIPITLLDEKYLDKSSAIGAFTGIAGTLYMLDALADVSKDKALRNLVEDKMFSCSRLIQFDDKNDLIAGSAGYLAVALKMAKQGKCRQKINQVIELLVSHLLENCIIEGNLAYWNCSAQKHYSGFSHGSAGIHTYLKMAMNYLGDDRANTMIQKSMNYEKSCFDLKENNWFRSELEQKVSHAWCHGAPGILLSKLLLYREDMQNDYVIKDLEVALMRTREFGFGNNPTYCHGDLGNLAIIDFAGRILKRNELLNKNSHIFQELFQNILVKKWMTDELKSCNT